MEILYAQEHYKLVLWKANRLINKPDYDFSLLPKFYKSLSLFQLAQNDRWFRRNQNAMQEAEKLFELVKNSNDGKKVLLAHIFEVSSLKEDLYQWGSDLERMGRAEESAALQKVLETLFDRVPNIDDKKGTSTKQNLITISGSRGELITFAQTLIGTPYLWAGVTPKGFDCSGFTSYVYNSAKIQLPRRAADQYDKSEKIKEKNLKPGDLVFFSHGGGVSHVGIVLSNASEPLKMIHSSSSQGIVITDVSNSAYWKKRITGYGKFLND
ncbi:MAG: C40 family peptidase [Bacteroidetes bacterium]|nr:C40 family peptidase [Bacteroidota bacterium]